MAITHSTYKINRIAKDRPKFLLNQGTQSWTKCGFSQARLVTQDRFKKLASDRPPHGCN
jgi:hypothetical protein